MVLKICQTNQTQIHKITKYLLITKNIFKKYIEYAKTFITTENKSLEVIELVAKLLLLAKFDQQAYA